MDSSAVRVEVGIRRGRRGRVAVGAPLVAVLSRALVCRSSGKLVSAAPAAAQSLRLDVYSFESLPRSRLVFLHLLVSRISEDGSAFRYGVYRPFRLDSI